MSRRGLAATALNLIGLTGCASQPHAVVSQQRYSREFAPLIVTEVSQSTEFGGSTGDKVEVLCASRLGCGPFKVCDPTIEGETTCSAVQPPLGGLQRVVVSRGASITATDPVWLADVAGNELPGTRVGPFDCANGLSRARADCLLATFGGCSAPNLGLSSGACTQWDTPEAFTFSLRFTTNQHGRPEPTCLRPVCQELLTEIQNARTSIDFAIYGIRAAQPIVDALAAAQARGVVVRGVVDTVDSTCTKFGYPDTPLLMSTLGPARVVCDTGPGYSHIMHNKFFIFDHQKVWTGSTNLSDTELGGEYSSDVAALLSSYRLARIYTSEFEEMFGGSFHRRKSDNTVHILDTNHFSDGTLVKSYFSPTDRARDNAIIPLIASAKASLDIAMFYFTSQEVANALLAARARGVVVRMILDAGGAANRASKHEQLCGAGALVKVENWGGKSHSKWAVADAAIAGAAAVVFGSMNWTSAGDSDNDENTLYVRNDSFAASFYVEFERQWADLAGVPVCTAVSVEGADSSVCPVVNNCGAGCVSGSCCDGIDNDYDGRVDLAEEACSCADGIDNDGDGYVDGDDYDCRPMSDPE